MLTLPSSSANTSLHHCVCSRNPGLKLVVNALLRAVPAIINVGFVSVLFFLIFGIIAVSYFKGKFQGCHGTVVVAEGTTSRSRSHNSHVTLHHHTQATSLTLYPPLKSSWCSTRCPLLT